MYKDVIESTIIKYLKEQGEYDEIVKRRRRNT